MAAGTNSAKRRGPWPNRLGGERAARTIRARRLPASFSAAMAAGSNGGSTMAKLVVAGSASGSAIAPSSFELDDARDGDQRRIEAAGARGDDEVARPERIAADLERADLDRAVAAPLRDDRDAAAKKPRRHDARRGRRRAGRARRAAPTSMIRPTSPSAERTGMPLADAVLRAGREDREAARAVERGADDAPRRDRVARMLAQLQRGLEAAGSPGRSPCASTIRWSIAVRSRLSSPFWRAASQ